MHQLDALRDTVVNVVNAAMEGDNEALMQVAVAVLVVVVAVFVFQAVRGDGSTVSIDVGSVGDFPIGDMKEVQIKRPGHSRKESILVVHTDADEFSAFPSKCTHSNIPLGKGVVHSDRLVCYAHGACFNASTGDIEDGPCVDGLPKFPVDRSGGRVVVRVPGSDGKTALPRCRSGVVHSRGAVGVGESVVVVGGGAASLTAVETLRKEGWGGRVVLVSKEEEPLFDRTTLTKNLDISYAKGRLRDVAQWAKELDVDVRGGCEVVSVDAESKKVRFRDIGGGAGGGEGAGGEVGYDHCIVATGGKAMSFREGESRFSIPGADLGNVFVIRDPKDTPRVRAAIAAKRGAHVLILGSSFVGMEAAAMVAGSCLEAEEEDELQVARVMVVGLESEPFERVFGTQVGKGVRELFETKNIDFFMRSKISSFEASGEEEGLVTHALVQSLDSEESQHVRADIVIIGAGIIPNVHVLRGNEGLDFARGERGVVVDAHMRVAGADRLYAVGDIACFPYSHSAHPSTDLVRIEHWDVAMDQGRVAARSILGKDAPYDCVPFFWTIQFEWSLRYAGHARKVDKTIIQGTQPVRAAHKITRPKLTIFYCAEGKVCAVGTVCNDPQAAAAMELFRMGAMPSQRDVEDADGAFDLVACLAGLRA